MIWTDAVKRVKMKHETYLEMATTFSKLSKDESSKVGAIIVDKDGRVVSMGYNGAANGVNDSNINYEGKKFKVSLRKHCKLVDMDIGDKFMVHKNDFMIHAELNAILNADDRSRLQDATIYVTHYPCNNCANTIIQSGIKEVHVLDNKTSTVNEYLKKSLWILEDAHINLVVHKVK